MPGTVSGTYVTVTAVGVLLVWSGLNNTSLSATVKALLSGKLPAPGTGGQAVPGAAAGTGGGTGSVSGYGSPFKGTAPSPERIDQGVDYVASSPTPIYAIAPGTVLISAPTGSGWPHSPSNSNGGWISYKITSGPLSGRIVYVAENISGLVPVGTTVSNNTAICTMGTGQDGIETGWANTNGHTDNALASQYNQEATGGDPGAWTSAAGNDFNDVLVFLGAPSGISNGNHGTMPPGWTPSKQLLETASTGPLGTGTGTAPQPGVSLGNQGFGSAAQNQAYVQQLATQLGHPDWTTGQAWSDWVSLWTKESNWEDEANPTSTARGIAQNLQGYGPDYVQGDLTSQATWGINYIAGKYGSPVMAWAHEQANNWY